MRAKGARVSGAPFLFALFCLSHNVLSTVCSSRENACAHLRITVPRIRAKASRYRSTLYPYMSCICTYTQRSRSHQLSTWHSHFSCRCHLWPPRHLIAYVKCTRVFRWMCASIPLTAQFYCREDSTLHLSRRIYPYVFHCTVVYTTRMH